MPRKELYVQKPADYAFGYEHVEKFLAHESSRAAVIIFAAKIEELLDRILKKHLVPVTTNTDDLFDGDSPLATFSAKTRIAYRIGLIDITFVRTLDLIRKVRNAFAHNIEGCKLTEHPHLSRVHQLVQPLRQSPAFAVWKKTFFEGRSDIESDFFAAAAYTLMRLDKIYIATSPMSPDEAYVLVPEKFFDASEA